MEKLVEEGKVNYLLLLLCVLIFSGIFVIGFGFVKAVENLNSNSDLTPHVLNASNDSMIEGKNLVKFDRYVEVKLLVSENRQIESVSYYDSFFDKNIGYVNVFGGIGKDFVIIPGQEYEISVKNSGRLKIN